jgi:protein-tyrosine phosphatase
MELIDANEVLPRLWIGTTASCDAARPLGVFCLCVLESPHGLCTHQRILGDDGRAGLAELTQACRLIEQEWRSNRRGVLVHCGAGVERSPLTVAIWMIGHFCISLDDAYAWLKKHRPQIEDRRAWLHDGIVEQ